MRATHHVETGGTVCTRGEGVFEEYGVERRKKKKVLEAVPSVQRGKQEIWSALSRERLELLIQSSLSLIFIYLICNREVCLEVGGHSSLCKVWREQTKLSKGFLSLKLFSFCYWIEYKIFFSFILSPHPPFCHLNECPRYEKCITKGSSAMNFIFSLLANVD